jgi:hypothetical protein
VNLVTIPYSRLDPGNAVARAYCVEPDAALQRFSWDYRDPRALRPLADLQAQRARPALGPVLAEYNRAVGGDAERAARIDDGFCVVSGQQVGLLLGPAYTTYKLFTVVNAARELEKELGAPVTPVFWVESEDHDWDEVNRFFWKGRRYRLEQDVRAGAPVADVEADPTAFLQQMREALGEGEAWDLVTPDGGVAGWGVARWHVRNLARLVEGVGSRACCASRCARSPSRWRGEAMKSTTLSRPDRSSRPTARTSSTRPARVVVCREVRCCRRRGPPTSSPGCSFKTRHFRF